MKVVLIGADDQTVEFVELSIRIRWPGVTPLVATTALDGLGMVERFSPEVVLIHPAFSGMSLSQTIQELRRFSTVPMLVLSNQ